MKFYKLGSRGGLKNIKKASFNEKGMYLIDDYKIIYLWFGKNTLEKEREYGLRKAEKLKNERHPPAKLQVNFQNKEYGSFIVIKELLEKGKSIENLEELRNELEVEIEDTMDFVEAGLEPDLEGLITLKTHDLSKQEKSYEELCQLLAEKQLKLVTKSKISKKKLDKKTKEILTSSASYDELCWLISELDILNEKKHV